MAFPSFVADAAVSVVRAVAEEIGTTADDLSRQADTLVFDPRGLALEIGAALVAVTDIAILEELAFRGLSTYPEVVGTTLNRVRERDNQSAIVVLLRGIATVRFAEEVGVESYRDRQQAVASRDMAGEALDDLAEFSDTDTFASMRALRAAVVGPCPSGATPSTACHSGYSRDRAAVHRSVLRSL